MEPEDSNATSQRFAWFALGAMVGVTAAMLLAPDKGSHTRRRLASQAKSHGQSLFDSSHEIIGRGRELFEKGVKSLRKPRSCSSADGAWLNPHTANSVGKRI